jgi:hypothetical protein
MKETPTPQGSSILRHPLVIAELWPPPGIAASSHDAGVLEDEFATVTLASTGEPLAVTPFEFQNPDLNLARATVVQP